MELSGVLDNLNKSILNHKVFKMLLKNDFVIYGSIINSILAGKNQFKDFKDNEKIDNSISVYGKFSYREILERDIGEFITKPYLLGNEMYTKTIFISYTLIIEDISFSLDILFIKNDQIKNYLVFYNELLLTVSIDNLQLSRTGLSVIDNKIGCIDPFGEIIDELCKKEFSIIDILKPLTKRQCEYIRYLADLGYKNKNNILKPYFKKDEECTICYDDEYTQFVQLECKHIFHKVCLQKAINMSLKEHNYFKCPYCSTKYLNYEVI